MYIKSISEHNDSYIARQAQWRKQEAGSFIRVLLLSEQCRVKLTAGRAKSQGSVDGIEDVITSLFLKPTAYRSPETRIARGGN